MSAAAGAGTGASRFSFFLSHQWGDKPVVEALKRRLEQRPGVRCWIDTEQMAAGAWLFDAIQDGIDESAVFMAFVSEGYLASDNCNKVRGGRRAARVQPGRKPTRSLTTLPHASRFHPPREGVCPCDGLEEGEFASSFAVRLPARACLRVHAAWDEPR